MPNHRSLPPILGFDVSVGILPRKIVVCRDFISRAVATFWVMSVVGIYPGRASLYPRQNSWFVFEVHHMNFTFKLKFLYCYLVFYVLHQGFNMRILYSSFNFYIRDYH